MAIPHCKSFLKHIQEHILLADKSCIHVKSPLRFVQVQTIFLDNDLRRCSDYNGQSMTSHHVMEIRLRARQADGFANALHVREDSVVKL
jgi:hypothetical protein